jgi:hypothetical protein
LCGSEDTRLQQLEISVLPPGLVGLTVPSRTYTCL